MTKKIERTYGDETMNDIIKGRISVTGIGERVQQLFKEGQEKGLLQNKQFRYNLLKESWREFHELMHESDWDNFPTTELEERQVLEALHDLFPPQDKDDACEWNSFEDDERYEEALTFNNSPFLDIVEYLIQKYSWIVGVKNVFPNYWRRHVAPILNQDNIIDVDEVLPKIMKILEKEEECECYTTTMSADGFLIEKEH